MNNTTPSLPQQPTETTSWYSRVWAFVSNLGQCEKDAPYLSKKIVLTNQISIFILLLVLSSTLFSWIAGELQLTITWFLCLSVVVAVAPLLNYLQYRTISRLLVSTVLPLFLVLFVAHIRAVSPETVHPASFYIPRYFLIGLSFMPLILFSFEERKQLLLAFAFNVTILLFYNEIMDFFNAGMGVSEPVIEGAFFISISSVVGLFIVSTGYFFLSSLNREYEVQNKLLQEKTEQQNRNMQDAVNYAKNIQQVVLPAAAVLHGLQERLFVVYRPLHTVSGDFYMVKESSDHILFSVIDCTGHGVPGAFVSILASASIKRSIDLMGYSNPSIILNNANMFFHEDLSRSGNPDMRDGMDMAMCSFNKHTNELKMAGANLSVHIVSKDVVTEYKTDKGGISIGMPERSFTTTTIQLQEGDQVYISSDGYYDQFGGKLDKRLGKRAYREKLQEVSKLPITNQHQYLTSFFEDWKKDSFQVDDVCLIGFRC